MHECPNCGQACDCIGDDTWNPLESLECEHDCEDSEQDDFDDFGIEEGFEDDEDDFELIFCDECGAIIPTFEDDGFGLCSACEDFFFEDVD